MHTSYMHSSYMHTQAYTYANTHAYTHAYISKHICIHMPARAYTWIHMHTQQHHQASANISKHQQTSKRADSSCSNNRQESSSSAPAAVSSSCVCPFLPRVRASEKKKNKTQNQDPGTKTGPRGNNGSSQTAHFYLFGMVHIAIATSAGNDVNGSSKAHSRSPNPHRPLKSRPGLRYFRDSATSSTIKPM